MKRMALILLALLLLTAFGCAGKTPATDDPNVVFIDPNAVRGGEYGELYFETNGVRFGIFDESAEVLSKLPAYRDTFTGESCAFDSADVYYYYSGFQIMTNEIDGTSRVTAITVADDTVKTPQGLYIGMSETEAEETFPELSEAEWNLVDGTAQLSVAIVDGAVAGIVYTPAGTED